MSKRKGAFLEDVSTTFDEELYDVLYKIGNSSHFHKALEIFNKPFNIRNVIDGLDSTISDLLMEFLEGTLFGQLEGYIHLDNVIVLGGITKSSAIRRYHLLDEEHKRIAKECMYHTGHQCKLVQQDIGFLLYLSLWLDSSSKEKNIDNPSAEEEPEEYNVEQQMDVDDIETTMETIEEKAIVEKFSPSIFRTEIITKLKSINPKFLEEENDSLACLLISPLTTLMTKNTFCCLMTYNTSLA